MVPAAKESKTVCSEERKNGNQQGTRTVREAVETTKETEESNTQQVMDASSPEDPVKPDLALSLNQRASLQQVLPVDLVGEVADAKQIIPLDSEELKSGEKNNKQEQQASAILPNQNISPMPQVEEPASTTSQLGKEGEIAILLFSHVRGDPDTTKIKTVCVRERWPLTVVKREKRKSTARKEEELVRTHRIP